jgi:hypothetical protein
MFFKIVNLFLKTVFQLVNIKYSMSTYFSFHLVNKPLCFSEILRS